MWCCIYGLQLKSKRVSMLHDEVCLQPSEKVILSLISPRLTMLSNRSIDIRKSLSFTVSLSIVVLSSSFRWANLCNWLTLRECDCSSRCSYRTLHVISKSFLITVGVLCLQSQQTPDAHSFRIMKLKTLWLKLYTYRIPSWHIRNLILCTSKFKSY